MGRAGLALVENHSFVPKLIRSRIDPVSRIIYDKGGITFDSVVFSDISDGSLTVCASSQIGCAEKCAFCATGDQPFVKNLEKEDIKRQIVF